MPKEKLIFLDGTDRKCEPRRLHGLAPKGKKARVESRKQEAINLGLIFGVPYPITSPLL
jgi:hypothetical protein